MVSKSNKRFPSQSSRSLWAKRVFSKTWNCWCRPGVDRSKRIAFKGRHAYAGKHALIRCSAVSSINSNRECIFQCAECACLLWHACDYRCCNRNAHAKVNMRILHIEICTWHAHSRLELIEDTALHLISACFPASICMSPFAGNALRTVDTRPTLDIAGWYTKP